MGSGYHWVPVRRNPYGVLCPAGISKVGVVCISCGCVNRSNNVTLNLMLLAIDSWVCLKVVIENLIC